jgi:aryl-alcohol dehydrogenase-like predicted oxidoreductase
MQYKLLGATGLRVSELCLGAMTFGEDWDWGANKDVSRTVFEAFAEAGGNFIDTANVYTNGTSEKMLGEFVGSERDRFVIATKYTVMTNPNDPNSSGNQRKNLMRSLEASLNLQNLFLGAANETLDLSLHPISRLVLDRK